MIDDRFLPRVWTDEGYYYPIFSELGITYENKKLPFTEENLKDINWAFRWRFNHFNENVDMEYINTLEQCTGLKDKNGNLIYEGDIVKRDVKLYRVDWCQDKLSFVLRSENSPDDILESLDITIWNWEITSNIHENPELLEVLK